MFDPNQRNYHNHTSEYRIYGRYSYDGIGQRKRIIEYASFGDQAGERLDIIELYNIKKAYVTNIDTKECTIYDIEHPFGSHDIPASAIFQGYEIIGSYPDQLTLSQWFNPTDSFMGINGTQYLTFTEATCIPVRDDRFNDQTGFHYQEFSNVVLGFSDPNVFIPPSNCKPQDA